MNRPHGNPQALSAIIRAAGAQKQAVALASDLSAPALSHVLNARRHAYDERQRQAIADGLSEVLGFRVSVKAITCHCDDPASHREDD